MAIQSPKSAASYSADILSALAQSGITQLAPGGKARAFADIMASELGVIETNDFINITATLLPFATGNSLDLIGQIFGVTRIQQQDATVDSGDDNFQFYVRTGTFGDINSGQDINIPANVQIFTDDPNGPIYLTDAVTLLAGNSTQSFSATSVYPGSSGNVASQVFTHSNFTGYTDAAFGSLLVTNNYGVIGGRDVESDTDYQYRIHLKLTAQNGINEAAVRYQLLQLPGIQDVAFSSSAGNFLAYLYGISPVIPPSLIQLANTTLTNTVAFPIQGTALSPDLVGISLSTTVSFVSGVAAADQTAALSAAASAAANYINNLGIGAMLVINQLAAQILASDSRIQDIGQPDDEILSIFVWRARADGSRYSRYLVANYTPQLGERIVVEMSISNPINLTAA
jgi:hypothetical protein